MVSSWGYFRLAIRLKDHAYIILRYLLCADMMSNFSKFDNNFLKGKVQVLDLR